jgi:hypothetical protein
MKCTEDDCEVYELCKWRVGKDACESLSLGYSGTMFVQMEPKEFKVDYERLCQKFKKRKYVTNNKYRLLRPENERD